VAYGVMAMRRSVRSGLYNVWSVPLGQWSGRGPVVVGFGDVEVWSGRWIWGFREMVNIKGYMIHRVRHRDRTMARGPVFGCFCGV
jgi:hypothetical protein